MIAARARKPCWTGTPEVYFAKRIDNSRLVKVADPKRSREMRSFVVALCCLFLLVMTYAWQHFSAIEYGYRIEALKSQREGLVEINRTLQVEQSSLRSPDRIDALARSLHLQPTSPGQVLMLDAPVREPGAPEMARMTSLISVISAR
jgi:cell division protein FtsL